MLPCIACIRKCSEYLAEFRLLSTSWPNMPIGNLGPRLVGPGTDMDPQVQAKLRDLCPTALKDALDKDCMPRATERLRPRGHGRPRNGNSPPPPPPNLPHTKRWHSKPQPQLHTMGFPDQLQSSPFTPDPTPNCEATRQMRAP